MGERAQPDLGAALRREAGRHVADRDAMLSRIVHRRSEPSPGRWSLAPLRPLAAAASVVAMLVVGFTTIRTLGAAPDDEDPPAVTAGPAPSVPTSSAPPAPSPAAGRTPDATGGTATKPSQPAAPSTAGTDPVKPRGSGAGRSSGFLSANALPDPHSLETWTQQNLTLRTTGKLTKLSVMITVSRSAGVQDAGKWTTIPASMMTFTRNEREAALEYRFVLKPGMTLAPGEYVVAAQYQHPAGRNPAVDTYRASATSGEQEAEVTGTFAAD